MYKNITLLFLDIKNLLTVHSSIINQSNNTSCKYGALAIFRKDYTKNYTKFQ